MDITPITNNTSSASNPAGDYNGPYALNKFTIENMGKVTLRLYRKLIYGG